MGGRVVQGEEVATAGCAAGEVATNPYLLSTNPLMLATGERRSKLSLQAIRPRWRPDLRMAFATRTCTCMDRIGSNLQEFMVICFFPHYKDKDAFPYCRATLTSLFEKRCVQREDF